MQGGAGRRCGSAHRDGRTVNSAQRERDKEDGADKCGKFCVVLGIIRAFDLIVLAVWVSSFLTIYLVFIPVHFHPYKDSTVDGV